MASNYIDFSNTGGYATTSLFRPSKYMRVGNSIVRSPTEFNLSELYAPKNIYSPLPQTLSKAPQVAPVLPQQPTSAIPITNTPNVETYAEQDGWQKLNTIEGNTVWMPSKRADQTPIQNGDIYTASDGTKYVYNNNTWLKLKYVADSKTGQAYYQVDDLQPFIGSNQIPTNMRGKIVEYVNVGNSPNLHAAWERNINQAKANIENLRKGIVNTIYNRNPVDFTTGQLSFDKINSAINWSKSAIRDLTALWNQYETATRNRRRQSARNILQTLQARYGVASGVAISSLRHKLLNDIDYLQKAAKSLTDLNKKLNVPEPTVLKTGAQAGFQNLGEVTNWQQQLQDTIDKFRKGEISTNPADLANGNWAEQWLGKVIGDAQKTGLLVEPFTDANGNLSPEIQNIINTYNENIANAHTEEMKNLRLAAIQRGHSPNDVYYNKTLSNWQAQASMEMANNISNLLVNEMQNSYQFITNALADALKASNKATEADMLQTEMGNQWAQALDNYKQQVQTLAQEMADTNAARQGQIVTAIIGLISSVLGAVI